MEEENKNKIEETFEDLKEAIEEKIDEVAEKFKEEAPKFEQKAEEAKEKIAEALETEDETEGFDQADVDKNKAFAVIAYFGILVLIPIFLAKGSKFARFHSNQGLILMICGIAAAVLSKVPVIKWFVWIIEIAIFVLFIMGILNAARGKAKRLPVIGGLDLIK